MDWKRYYRAEFDSPNIGDQLGKFFTDVEADVTLGPLVAQGAVISFPHTALRYAGPLQARVIVGLHRAKIERIVALGVYHLWGHARSSALYKLTMNEGEERSKRAAAFAKLRGAFRSSDPVQETPFGPIPLASIRSSDDIVREDTRGLMQEFSLDTFMSLLAFYYREQRESAPEVVPIYIGMTRNPLTGSFTIASQLAAVIREELRPGSAVVATGDLVHYGTRYTSKERMAKMPTDYYELWLYFEREVKRTLEISLVEGNYTEAFHRCENLLNNDQRYLLPVVAEFLSTPARYELLSFSLSDYSEILHVPKPCVVASTLVLYRHQIRKEE